MLPLEREKFSLFCFENDNTKLIPYFIYFILIVIINNYNNYLVFQIDNMWISKE